jgi:hypothetical protein
MRESREDNRPKARVTEVDDAYEDENAKHQALHEADLPINGTNVP